MKLKLQKIRSWKIALAGAIFQLIYAFFIFLYLTIANYLNFRVGPRVFGLIIVMIYSLILFFIGGVFALLFLIRNQIVRKVSGVVAVASGVAGLTMLFFRYNFFVPLSISLIWAGVRVWKADD